MESPLIQFVNADNQFALHLEASDFRDCCNSFFHLDSFIINRIIVFLQIAKLTFSQNLHSHKRRKTKRNLVLCGDYIFK